MTRCDHILLQTKTKPITLWEDGGHRLVNTRGDPR